MKQESGFRNQGTPLCKRGAGGDLRVRNWRIVAGILALLLVYSWMGSRDGESHGSYSRPVFHSNVIYIKGLPAATFSAQAGGV